MPSEINAIILAGGKNSRMEGRDKAFLEIEGKPIVEHLINKFKALVNEIIVVTNNPEKYSAYPVKLASDEKPGLGPLMGIYCGLKASSAGYNFVAACDMPFLDTGLIKYMIDSPRAYDALIPEIDNQLHPLCGLYSRNCLAVIEEMLRQDRRDVRSIFPKLKVRYLAKEELVKFDKGLFSFVNINTEDEYKKSPDYLPLLRGRL
ncbi:MAG: molybdenum cofactor guanylyltransferase [Candidatus Omnitrophota bacterium]